MGHGGLWGLLANVLLISVTLIWADGGGLHRQAPAPLLSELIRINSSVNVLFGKMWHGVTRRRVSRVYFYRDQVDVCVRVWGLLKCQREPAPGTLV